MHLYFDESKNKNQQMWFLYHISYQVENHVTNSTIVTLPHRGQILTSWKKSSISFLRRQRRLPHTKAIVVVIRVVDVVQIKILSKSDQHENRYAVGPGAKRDFSYVDLFSTNPRILRSHLTFKFTFNHQVATPHLQQG